MTAPLTPEELAEIEALERACPWPAPWRAHTFEIDCPCPNGAHCGDSHTCEEVEAPEAYPDGQCVVQISVPGLERFARPVAAFIASARSAVPRLLADARAHEKRLAQVIAERDEFEATHLAALATNGALQRERDEAREQLARAHAIIVEVSGERGEARREAGRYMMDRDEAVKRAEKAEAERDEALRDLAEYRNADRERKDIA